ncbi:MAG: hypothetical protein AAGA97_09275 [Pseudomonadota bacterium]
MTKPHPSWVQVFMALPSSPDILIAGLFFLSSRFAVSFAWWQPSFSLFCSPVVQSVTPWLLAETKSKSFEVSSKCAAKKPPTSNASTDFQPAGSLGR